MNHNKNLDTYLRRGQISCAMIMNDQWNSVSVYGQRALTFPMNTMNVLDSVRMA